MRLCGQDDLSKRRRRRGNKQQQPGSAEDDGKGDMSSLKQQAEVDDDVDHDDDEGPEQRQLKGSLSNILLAEKLPRAWKPVIDGKLQSADIMDLLVPMPGKLSGGDSGHHISSSSTSMQSPSPSTSSRQQQRNTVAPAVKKDADEINDSDSEFRRVPEMPAPDKSVAKPRKRPGGVTANDKEGKRLKRLLRNRVSAQQARERKKAYLIDLEHKAKHLELRNAELEEKNATLQRENHMLRQIVKNTTMAHKAAGE